MNQHRLSTFVVALAMSLAALTGCEGARASTTRASAAVAAQPTVAELRAGVVAALEANRALNVQELWTNRIPASAPRSTRGPALAAMRVSASQRVKQRVRVRMLHNTYRVLSIRFNAARTSATAVAQWNQDVAPSHLDGASIGRAIVLDERASILLHRIGRSPMFVVWKVDLVK